jgi:L-fuconolactonase
MAPSLHDEECERPRSAAETTMRRRDLIRMAATGAGALALRRGMAETSGPIPIIDAHIHLFDTARPGGVPWPEKSDTALYKPATPERYMALAAPFGVVGAIAIEASPLPQDNDWLLQVVLGHPAMVGMIGDLVPGASDYLRQLDRLHGDPLFLGIRYGNLWGRDLSIDLAKPGFVDGLKAVAQAGLVLDSANPDPGLIHAILDVSEKVSGLRIVIDHLPHSPIPPDPAARREYESDLNKLAQNRNVYVKLSEIPALAGGKLVTDQSYYQAPLDAIWDLFGEDRILFGSDWPNSDHLAPYAQTMAIVRGYISKKSRAAQEKYYWKNSLSAYRWHRRTPDQPQL